MSKQIDDSLPQGMVLKRDGRVQVFTHERVALIRMNRPDKKNALDTQQIESLRSALSYVRNDTDSVVCVLTGSGGAFCAGGDITMFQDINPDTSLTFTRSGHALLRSFEEGELPVIAAVDGYCLAGGLEIALACDFIIAGESAVFGLTEVALGLIPGWGGTVRLAKTLPVRTARQLIFTAQKFNAAEAKSYGLVNEITDDKRALQRSLDIAVSIASQPGHAVRLARDVINRQERGGTFDAVLEMEAAIAANLFNTETVQSRVRRWIDGALKT